jgi:hypothetical protein
MGGVDCPQSAFIVEYCQVGGESIRWPGFTFTFVARSPVNTYLPKYLPTRSARTLFKIDRAFWRRQSRNGQQWRPRLKVVIPPRTPVSVNI